MFRRAEPTPPPRIPRAAGALVVLALTLACGRDHWDPLSGMPAEDIPDHRRLDLLFVFSSEKQAWVGSVTTRFNQRRLLLPDGRVVQVIAVPAGSGEGVDEILAGRWQAHLFSPSSAVFVELGNQLSQTVAGGPLLGPTRVLLHSPVVIAMWRPMAEVLGGPRHDIGWNDLAALARGDVSWAGLGHPEWGRFKFSHTRPEYSNSGMLALLAMAHAVDPPSDHLTPTHLAQPATAGFLSDLQRSVVRYGRSTGLSGGDLFTAGPGQLHAAILYESVVVEINRPTAPPLAYPVVAVYPREGTHDSDHPAGVVQRAWVSPAHRRAAEIFLDYLIAPAQQQEAWLFGFRPGDPAASRTSPFDRSHGVDPAGPHRMLAPPAADLIREMVRNLWPRVKKPAEVVLVLDNSESIDEGSRAADLRIGARELVAQLGETDNLSILAFNEHPAWMAQSLAVGPDRQRLARQIDLLRPTGGTALYDAVRLAHDHLSGRCGADRLLAVVVLTDGADTHSRTGLDDLLAQLQPAGEQPLAPLIPVFTVGLGSRQHTEVLRAIANATWARHQNATPDTIRSIIREIALFL